MGNKQKTMETRRVILPQLKIKMTCCKKVYNENSYVINIVQLAVLKLAISNNLKI